MLGDKIRALRKSRGLNQTDFAKPLFVTAGAVSQWEKGVTMPDTERLLAMSKIYEVPLSYFTDEPNEAQTKDPQTDKPNGVDNAMIRALMELPPDKVKLVREFLALPNDQALRLLGYFEGLKAASEDSPSVSQKDS